MNNENTIQIDKEEKEEKEEHNQGSKKIGRTVSTEIKQNIIIDEKEKSQLRLKM